MYICMYVCMYVCIYIYIYIYIYTVYVYELVAMLSVTASVAQLAEHRTRFAGSRVAKVAFSQQVSVRS